MWGSEDAHPWGFPLLVCKEAGASPNPVTGPASVHCLAVAGMPTPWGQVYTPCAGTQGAVGELAGCLLSYMAENNLSAGSFPPQKAFLGFSSGRESGLVVPFAEADFALSQSLRTWTCFTVI